MKYLYVSDLDGTLLRSDATLSDESAGILSRLVENGLLFTYATARSFITASKVTKNLTVSIPAIVYNGAFIVDSRTGKILNKNTFGECAGDILSDLISAGIYPIVYSMIDDIEKFSYLKGRETEGLSRFLKTRKGDVRERPVSDESRLFDGDIFYFTCIGDHDLLSPFHDKFLPLYNTVFHDDIYTKDTWLEIMPKNASKANAVTMLKKIINADKIISFGDGLNDLDLFSISDECYAVENAHDDLKRKAMQVIGANDDDSVAKWLSVHSLYA